jgi:hypothetical protein
MAYTTGRIKGNYCDILFGDGADPEVFTQLCGLKNFSLSVTYASAFEEEDFDCADPEAVAQTLREVGAQDWSMTGSGLYNRSQGAALRELLGKSQNWRFASGEPAGDAIEDGYWQGPGFISSWEEGAEKGRWKQLSITVTGTGLLTWADAV